jgi:hypothetical protein
MHSVEITYDSLTDYATDHSYTCHVRHFREMFAACDIPIRCFLEWGCGYATKIFIDNSQHVISVEQVDAEHESSCRWLRHCQQLFGSPKWTAIIEVCSPAVWQAASYAGSKHRDPALIDPSYLAELDAYIKKLAKTHELTVSFVDSGTYFRGDLVELSLQNKIPIVVAHDTASAYDDIRGSKWSRKDVNQYIWFKVQPHDDYEHIYIWHGAGTTFWIRKDLPKLRAAMRAYADSWQSGS